MSEEYKGTQPQGLKYIVSDEADAVWWARLHGDAWRGLIWSTAAKQANAIKKRGGKSEIRWWSARDKVHPGGHGHGLVEVVEVGGTKRTRTRKRVRRRVKVG